MEKTINGRTEKEVIEIFQRDFGEEDIKPSYDGKYEYIEVEALKARLREAVGYRSNFFIKDIHKESMGSESALNCIGILTIRYDDGTIWTSVSSIGAENIERLKEDVTDEATGRTSKVKTPEPVSLENAYRALDSDAFKRCCKALDIGVLQLERRKKNGHGKGNKISYQKNTDTRTAAAPASNISPAAASEFVLRFTGRAIKLGDQGYKIPAVLNETGETVYAMLYNSLIEEQITKCMEFESFINAYREKPITVTGVRSDKTYAGKPDIQIQVRGFKKREKAAS